MLPPYRQRRGWNQGKFVRDYGGKASTDGDNSSHGSSRKLPPRPNNGDGQERREARVAPAAPAPKASVVPKRAEPPVSTVPKPAEPPKTGKTIASKTTPNPSGTDVNDSDASGDATKKSQSAPDATNNVSALTHQFSSDRSQAEPSPEPTAQPKRAASSKLAALQKLVVNPGGIPTPGDGKSVPTAAERSVKPLC